MKSKNYMRTSKKSKKECEDFICSFCNKTFVRESSLINHCCIKKQRWLDKDQKDSVLAYYAWERFYSLTKASSKKNLSVLDFINSRYYNDFLKLAAFVHRYNIIHPKEYIDFLIKNSIRLNLWYTEASYEKFIKYFVSKEDPYSGVERSVRFIEKWADQKDKNIEDFFKDVNTNIAVNALRSGKISPWLIYISDNSNNLLDRLDDSQIKLIQDVINPVVWKIKLSKFKSEVRELKKILESAGL